jgi:hypothetical protein
MPLASTAVSKATGLQLVGNCRHWARKISEITGDGRWLIVGPNIDHLVDRSNAMYRVETPDGSIPPSAPTAEAAQRFTVAAATVLTQIEVLHPKNLR